MISRFDKSILKLRCNNGNAREMGKSFITQSEFSVLKQYVRALKAIAVIMAIVASTASEEMQAQTILHYNAGPGSTTSGILIFTQSSPTEKMKINGVLDFEPAEYVIVVHERTKSIRIDCDRLGPIKRIIGSFFAELVYIILDGITAQCTYIHELYTVSGTLVPDQPDSIAGHTIAFYNNSTFAVPDGENVPISPNIACGLV